MEDEDLGGEFFWLLVGFILFSLLTVILSKVMG